MHLARCAVTLVSKDEVDSIDDVDQVVNPTEFLTHAIQVEGATRRVDCGAGSQSPGSNSSMRRGMLQVAGRAPHSHHTIVSLL